MKEPNIKDCVDNTKLNKAVKSFPWEHVDIIRNQLSGQVIKVMSLKIPDVHTNMAAAMNRAEDMSWCQHNNL